jgi:hypothetical protein
MRTQIDQADLTEAKRASLLKKLTEFEEALEKDRLPVFAVARIVLEILSLTANTVALADSPTFAKLTSNIMQEVAKAKAEDDNHRRFPAIEAPRIALPPRPPDIGRTSSRPAPAKPRFSDLDDDIPF